jgi:hypothetical protein
MSKKAGKIFLSFVLIAELGMPSSLVFAAKNAGNFTPFHVRQGFEKVYGVSWEDSSKEERDEFITDLKEKLQAKRREDLRKERGEQRKENAKISEEKRKDRIKKKKEIDKKRKEIEEKNAREKKKKNLKKAVERQKRKLKKLRKKRSR